VTGRGRLQEESRARTRTDAGHELTVRSRALPPAAQSSTPRRRSSTPTWPRLRSPRPSRSPASSRCALSLADASVPRARYLSLHTYVLSAAPLSLADASVPCACACAWELSAAACGIGAWLAGGWDGVVGALRLPARGACRFCARHVSLGTHLTLMERGRPKEGKEAQRSSRQRLLAQVSSAAAAFLTCSLPAPLWKQRFMPLWNDTLVPLVKSGKRLLIAAHGNTLRALVKHLDDIPEVPLLSTPKPQARIPRPLEHLHRNAGDAPARTKRSRRSMHHPHAWVPCMPSGALYRKPPPPPQPLPRQ